MLVFAVIVTLPSADAITTPSEFTEAIFESLLVHWITVCASNGVKIGVSSRISATFIVSASISRAIAVTPFCGAGVFLGLDESEPEFFEPVATGMVGDTFTSSFGPTIANTVSPGCTVFPLTIAPVTPSATATVAIGADITAPFDKTEMCPTCAVSPSTFTATTPSLRFTSIFGITLEFFMIMELTPPPRTIIVPSTFTLSKTTSPSPTPSAMMMSPDIFISFSTLPLADTTAMPSTLPVYVPSF
ncbi:MAG: hypothetical protein BWY74_00711 [Firmicutes bacterium ADurb.Bin419]|nr:MAG: hypothetical protein BWY74_00711 [Firmicutes bacterium ADurb.Bin419]